MYKLTDKGAQRTACLVIGLLSAILVAGLQAAGGLQGLELRLFDRLLISGATTQSDQRIVIIGETEEDIRRYGHPLSDQVLADSLTALEKAGTRVIGVDKYRDRPVPPGSDQLQQLLQQYGNIIWIFFAGNSHQERVAPPASLIGNPERIGFNDVVEDADGLMRRGLLFMDVDQQNYYSFPLLLALHYLAGEQITAESDAAGFLSLNGISLPPIASHFGAYHAIDAGGYQIMLSYPHLPQAVQFYPISQLLDGRIDRDALRDKLVLLGGTAPSLNDYRFLSSGIRCFGVEQHASFVGQLLDAALDKHPPLRAASDSSEYLWLGFWSLLGACSGYLGKRLQQRALLIVVEAGILFAIGWQLLNQGWWLPLVAPLVGWLTALGLSILYHSNLEQAERRQLMQLFASHVSPEVANKIWESREQFFAEGGVRPDTLTATVLFTDLSNFTTLAESMEPLALMNWLNEYMEEMSRIVINHGGVINKYIGDAIMAVFGVPVKRETETEIAADALGAVECALDFNARLRELNQTWQRKDLPTITMRTGIYTGSLVAGSFGSSLRMEYTVIGDTVNTAARLESFDKSVATPDLANPCRILIGEGTRHYVGSRHPTELVGECSLKGKNQKIKIYRLLY